MAANSNTITYSYNVDARIRFDPLYVKTVSGILKVAALITATGGLITVASTSIRHDWEGSLYNTVGSIAIGFTLVMLLLYLFHVLEKFHNFPWLRIEIFVCTGLTIAYMVVSIVAITHNRSVTVAAVFAFCTLAVYAVEMVTKGKAEKAGQIAQGSRTVERPPPPTQPA